MLEPKPDPEPAPEPERSRQSSPQARDGAYSAKPEFKDPASPRRLWWAAGLAVILASALGAARLMAPAPLPTAESPAATSIAAVAKQQKVFLISAQDLDIKRTEAARRQLKAGQVPQELAQASKAVQQAVRDGEMGLYTVRLLDVAAEDGDIVELSLDGVPFAGVTISHAGNTLTIPLKEGRQQAFGIKGVFDGGGGITLGLESAAGGLQTPIMTVGQTETWTIGFQ